VFSAETPTSREEARRRHVIVPINICPMSFMLLIQINDMQQTIDFLREEHRVNLEDQDGIQETLSLRERQLDELRGSYDQREQQHAAEIEQLQAENRRLHEKSHQALQTAEGERDAARSSETLQEEYESLRAEIAQSRSNN